MARIPTKDLREAEPFNAFYFAPALSGKAQPLARSSPPTRRWSSGWSSSPRSPLNSDRASDRGLARRAARPHRSRRSPTSTQLFALPSAAVTLQAATGFTPTGVGRGLLPRGRGRRLRRRSQQRRRASCSTPATARRSSSARTPTATPGCWRAATPDDLSAPGHRPARGQLLAGGGGFGPQLLCSLVGFTDPDGRRLGLVYLYKRGTFYPFAPLPRQRRDNALELQVRGALGGDLPVEHDLGRWFPVWGAPGL